MLASNDHAIPVALPDLTIAIGTHNPLRDLLARTLETLLIQMALSLSLTHLVVDNASNPPLTDAELGLDQFLYPARICPESELGLTPARLLSFDEVSVELLPYVEVDNFLEPKYAAEVVVFFAQIPWAGVVSGRTWALPEAPLPSWKTPQLLSHLAVRDFGGAAIRFLHDRTPCGAGSLAMRADRADSAVFNDRKGSHPASFGASEICCSVHLAGWELWYELRLKLRHFRSAHRLEPKYYLRLLETMSLWPTPGHGSSSTTAVRPRPIRCWMPRFDGIGGTTGLRGITCNGMETELPDRHAH